MFYRCHSIKSVFLFGFFLVFFFTRAFACPPREESVCNDEPRPSPSPLYSSLLLSSPLFLRAVGGSSRSYRRGDVFAGRGPAGALCLRVIEFAVSRRCRCAAASGTQRRVEGRSLGASSLSPVRELRACEWLPHPDPGLGLCWASGCGCKARQARVWWKLARRQRQPASREYGLPTMREAKGKKTKGAAWRSVPGRRLFCENRGLHAFSGPWAWAFGATGPPNLTLATAQV